MKESDQVEPEQRSNSSGDDLELQEMVAQLRQQESQRQKKMAMITLVGLVVIGVAIWGLIEYRKTIFSVPLPIEQGEQDILAQTNDPVCRKVIANITEVGEHFFALEPRLEDELQAQSIERIEELEVQLNTMQERLDTIANESQHAVLRYDASRGELDTWIRFVTTELSVLQRIARERKQDIQSEADEQAKSNEELLGRALMAVHESFQNFRVWHTAAFHPCGQAPEGVEPWTP